MTEANNKLIGYWMSEKKSQKLNWTEFANVCRNHGYELVKLDLEKPFEKQGPFVLFLHKLTDILVLSNQGDNKSKELIGRIEDWISKNPQMVILDPLENVRKLLDRYLSYSVIEDSDLFNNEVFIPTFTEITTNDMSQIAEKLKLANVSYPFMCKPSVAHGSKLAHKMSVIFNESSLKDCRPPCVAQSFVNHNAVLYKIFIVGDYHCVVERPSLKNFHAGDYATIHFDSHDVSKADSKSALSVLDPSDLHTETIKPDPERLTDIVYRIRKALGMSLLGVDVVIENRTGKYAIIDINAYPGYDGFPNFFDALMVLIEDTISSFRFCEMGAGFHTVRYLSPPDADRDSGFDTADSSDERYRFKRNSLKSQPSEASLLENNGLFRQLSGGCKPY